MYIPGVKNEIPSHSVTMVIVFEASYSIGLEKELSCILIFELEAVVEPPSSRPVLKGYGYPQARHNMFIMIFMTAN